jgi:hypothetical protein
MATVDIKIEPRGKLFRMYSEVRGFAGQPNPVETYIGPDRDTEADAILDSEEIIDMLRVTFPGFDMTVTRKSAGEA